MWFFLRLGQAKQFNVVLNKNVNIESQPNEKTHQNE